ncbi:MAG: hypothetical protein Ct9H300mP11_18540 [Chloroflexota bacterium]|nr:MAG: hypothetical protein Ct9H300mP11_18540 [Chloroflexota bacterium]
MIDPNDFKSVPTPVFNIGYGDYGEGLSFPIFLLHGFPYEVISFDGVVQPLVEAGYRVLVPYLRGYGSTTFIDPDAPGNGRTGCYWSGCYGLCRCSGNKPVCNGWL